MLHSKLTSFGFSRDSLMNEIIDYASGAVGESASSSRSFNLIKAFVIEGASGVGKSWIMCQVTNVQSLSK